VVLLTVPGGAGAALAADVPVPACLLLSSGLGLRLRYRLDVNRSLGLSCALALTRLSWGGLVRARLGGRRLSGGRRWAAGLAGGESGFTHGAQGIDLAHQRSLVVPAPVRPPGCETLTLRMMPDPRITHLEASCAAHGAF
jgi:hypothetical protein